MVIACAQCGLEFARPVNRGRKPKFCSESCKNRASRIARGQVVRDPGQTRACIGCGERFEVAVAERLPRKWCSPACAQRVRRASDPARARAKENERNRKRTQERYEAMDAVPCGNCGTPFKPIRGRKWCSDGCAGLAAAHRRRARLLAAEFEEVKRVEVFERDEWTCGLCGGEINPMEMWPSRGAATVDHIVPISKGGAHTMANLQAAHFGCNSSKSDREVLPDGYSWTSPEANREPERASV